MAIETAAPIVRYRRLIMCKEGEFTGGRLRNGLVALEIPRGRSAGAEQLAEKVLQRRNYREGLLRGLKPDADWIGFIGPTKVVPLLQSL